MSQYYSHDALANEIDNLTLKPGVIWYILAALSLAALISSFFYQNGFVSEFTMTTCGLATGANITTLLIRNKINKLKENMYTSDKRGEP